MRNTNAIRIFVRARWHDDDSTLSYVIVDGKQELMQSWPKKSWIFVLIKWIMNKIGVIESIHLALSSPIVDEWSLQIDKSWPVPVQIVDDGLRMRFVDDRRLSVTHEAHTIVYDCAKMIKYRSSTIVDYRIDKIRKKRCMMIYDRRWSYVDTIVS